ncbi:MAG TPA: hypothetical protein ENK97_00795 [Campylobacteraceae bacterium]|nr:hypothetical protein [Campylobacteraceae bacterium]
MSPEAVEALKILNIYRMMQQDGTLYLDEDDARLDTLFDAVVHAICECGPLKTKLPYNEFVLPSRKVLEGDAGWVGHFKERDNRRFFLSDIHDYLTLLYGRNQGS